MDRTNPKIFCFSSSRPANAYVGIGAGRWAYTEDKKFVNGGISTHGGIQPGDIALIHINNVGIIAVGIVTSYPAFGTKVSDLWDVPHYDPVNVQFFSCGNDKRVVTIDQLCKLDDNVSAGSLVLSNANAPSSLEMFHVASIVTLLND